MVLHAVRFVREIYGEDAHERVLKGVEPQHWGTLLGPVREASWEPVEDLVAGHADVRYIQVDQRVPIGAKRNLACALARGKIIAHWDDDADLNSAWV